MESKLRLIQEQNRVIAILRHLMERGYFIIYLPDKNQFGVNLRTGRYALCKYPTPKDAQSGVLLFGNYDDAYNNAERLLWTERDITKNYGKVYLLTELDSLVRKVIVKE